MEYLNLPGRAASGPCAGDGSIKTDPNDPTRYQMRLIENPAGTILPTIGIIVEF
jgi:hypothetical protein